MTDLGKRFELLDRLHAPDLWSDAIERRPAEKIPGTSHRLAVALLALAVAAAGVGLGVWAVGRGTTPKPVAHPVPIVPKANGLIAFVGGRSGTILGPAGHASLYVEQPDGSGRKLLASEIGAHGGKEVAWSRDGTRLAYLRGGEFPGYELHVMDASGHQDRTILTVDQYLSGLTWSPDGRFLAVSMGGNGRSYDLYVIGSDG